MFDEGELGRPGPPPFRAAVCKLTHPPKPLLGQTGRRQLTRPFGTAPVDPGVAAVSLARAQARIVEAGRFGIPALAHEECLAGFTAWGATAYPVPLSWGAAWNPELVTGMAHRIGRDSVRRTTSAGPVCMC